MVTSKIKLHEIKWKNIHAENIKQETGETRGETLEKPMPKHHAKQQETVRKPGKCIIERITMIITGETK